MGLSILIAVIIFIFGLIFGSFFNVVISRLPKGESIAFPPSHCPKCNEKIKPYDNIPLLSHPILKGRCRACGGSISPRYFFVELLTGLLFLAAFQRFGLNESFLLALFLLSVLIVSAFIDLEEMIIPNKLIYPALGIAAFLTLASALSQISLPLIGKTGPIESLLGFLLGGAFLYLVAVIGERFYNQEVMGGGDIKLAAFMGIFLGRYVALALFLGFFFGSLFGLISILQGNDLKKLIPFGPSLALGGAVTLLYGPNIYRFYISLAFR